MPATAAAAQIFNDIAGHWAEAHLTEMAQMGIIVGDGRGNALPDRLITRREASLMLDNIFGTLEPVGADTAPNGVITREEAFTSIREAFRLPAAPNSLISAFPDFEEVSGWAQNDILAMEAAGIIAGKNGMIAPSDSVSFAEYAVLLSKSAGMFINQDTDFAGAETERALIIKSGITVQNLTAEYLIIAQGADAVLLENCDIGSLYIYGGGIVRLAGSFVTELYGAPSVYADENSLIERRLP
jgi:hypothetical protein